MAEKTWGLYQWGSSSDTIGRVFAALDPKSFNACFTSWIESIRKKSAEEIVAVDGKSIRGANPKRNGNEMPHIVSAFAANNGITLGRIKVDEKAMKSRLSPSCSSCWPSKAVR